ncbi:MAG: pilus assembly protein PilM, partial [Clostridia bacterium]|nr:pilus assembly protein PilM [Clostridia bacterium]
MGNIFTKDIAVLDVTSRLVSAIVGSKKAQSVFGIKAVSELACQGYENGEWFDAVDTIQVAKDVLVDAMKKAGSRTKRLFVSVPAEFVTVVCKEVSVTLDKKRRVLDEDIDYLLEKGNDFEGSGYETINTSAIYFAIDDNEKLFSDVRGMDAERIEACVSYVLCEKSYLEMFDEVGDTLGFKDIRYIATPWAECMGLLEKEQRDKVYMLIDVGYMSTFVALAKGDGILDLKSFSMGGAHIAGDIYEALEVPFELAEEAKRLVDLNLNYTKDAVLVSSGEDLVRAADALEVAKSRLDVFADIFGDILKEIEADVPGYMEVYLTGEGIASIRGAKKYLSEQLGKNIEIITPKLPGFIKPEDSSKASVLLMADTL